MREKLPETNKERMVENTRHCTRQHYTDVPDSMHEWVWWARTLGMQSSSIISNYDCRSTGNRFAN